MKKILKTATLIVLFSLAIFAQTITKIEKTAYVEPTNTKTFVATAYSLKGKMANGQNVHYGAVAADPRVLPLGSVIKIEGLGQFVVKDTGGAIKGSRLDIWFPTKASAIKWGRRTVRVMVVSKPNKKLKV